MFQDNVLSNNLLLKGVIGSARITSVFFLLPDAKVRLEKLREDAELRQKREHMKYMEKLMVNSSEGEAPLLKITQEKKELALQGSTDLIKQEEEKESTPKNLPFFQCRKPIDLNLCNTKTSDRKRAESNYKKLLNSEKDLGKVEDKPSINPVKNNESAKPSIPSASSQKKTELSPSELARREHFSRLRQAGWIMGLDGKWHKDENAEFDSDEDEPPPPP